MAQKVNPIAVRLNLNRFSDSNWFSDYYYSTLLFQDINTRHYLASMKQPNANKLGFRVGKCIIHHFPKKSLLHVFCLSEFRMDSVSPSEIQGSRKKVIPFRHYEEGKSELKQDCNMPKTNLEYPKESITEGQKETQFLFSWFDSNAIQKKKGLVFLSRQISQGFSEKKRKFLKKNLKENNSKNNFSWDEQFQQQPFFLSRGKEKTKLFFPLCALSYFFFQKVNFMSDEKVLVSKDTLRTKLQNAERKNNLLTKQLISNFLFSWKHLKNQGEFEQFPLANESNSKDKNLSSFSVPFPKSTDFYFSNISSVLSQNYQSYLTFNSIKVKSIYQSASLLAQEITCKLEQKKSFRSICRTIFQQHSSYKYIKGIRIACSGRLNGAEIAKTEWKKFGETSLHVFSERIDYAFAKASTPYGILGVKVWISYY